ncbi:unnamed protein product [Effrenium voratum]|nr:unnamed protein product [Effrenium voratum]
MEGAIAAETKPENKTGVELQQESCAAEMKKFIAKAAAKYAHNAEFSAKLVTPAVGKALPIASSAGPAALTPQHDAEVASLLDALQEVEDLTARLLQRSRRAPEAEVATLRHSVGAELRTGFAAALAAKRSA